MTFISLKLAKLSILPAIKIDRTDVKKFEIMVLFNRGTFNVTAAKKISPDASVLLRIFLLTLKDQDTVPNHKIIFTNEGYHDANKILSMHQVQNIRPSSIRLLVLMLC